MSAETGSCQIPTILRGSAPPLSDSPLGTKNYANLPVAVILGGGFDDAAAELMMSESTGIHPVPWLRPDLTQPAPPLGPEYGRAMVAWVKAKLAELERDGNMHDEQVFWY